jgi:hypothetical protein
MKHNRSLLGVLVVAGIVLTGCARAVNPDTPDPLAGPGRETPFCQQVIAYRSAINALNGNTLVANPGQAQQLVMVAHDGAQKLVDLTTDPVLKADMQTIVAGYDRMAKTMAGNVHSDPQQQVLALVAFGQDKQVTLAATALQNYARSFCGLNMYQVPTKGAAVTVPPTTTVVGPIGPTTTGNPGATSTTSAGSSPTTTAGASPPSTSPPSTPPPSTSPPTSR